MKRVLNFDLKLGISDQLIEDMISECSMGGDAGQVNERQFVKFMKKVFKIVV